MLQNIRERTQSWVSITIIVLICASFALWGISYYLTGWSSTSKAAKVFGQIITSQQVTHTYDRMRKNYLAKQQSRFIQLTKSQVQHLKAKSLQYLVDNTAFSYVANSQGFTVLPSMISEAIHSLPIFQLKNRFSYQVFYQRLLQLGYTEASFIAEVEQSLLTGQVESAIKQSSFLLPNEVGQLTRLHQQKRTVRYAVIKNRLSTPLTVKQLRQYYQKNQSQFMVPEKVKIAYLVLSPEQLMKTMRPSLVALQDFYQNNSRLYTKQKQWQVERIILPYDSFVSKPKSDSESKKGRSKNIMQEIERELKASKGVSSLEELAQKYKNTGVLFQSKQWVSSDKLAVSAKEFEVVSHLKVGGYSQVIQGDKKQVIIKLTALKAARLLPFSEVKPKVIQDWKQQHVQARLGDLTDQLSTLTYTNPNTLNVAAKRLNLSVNKSQLFSKTSQALSIFGKLFASHHTAENTSALKQLIAASFSQEVLDNGNNSAPLTLPDGRVVVLRVLTHQPMTVKPYKQVKQLIKRQLLIRQAKVETQGKAEQVASALTPKVTFKQALLSVFPKGNQFTSIHSASITLHGEQYFHGKLKEAVFGMPNQVGSIKIVALPSRTLIIQLQKVDVPNRDEMGKVSDPVNQALFAVHQQQFDYQGYRSSVLNNASIKFFKPTTVQ